MSTSALQISVQTPPDTLPVGRGFYQLEEESLYVQVSPFDRKHRFFSYLEANSLRLDIDKEGRLLFIEVSIPRRRWPVDENLSAPAGSKPADVRWLDFRRQVRDPRFFTNAGRSVLKIDFSRRTDANDSAGQVLRIAESVCVTTDSSGLVRHIWITDIVDDLAGQEIASFRRQSQ
jgi:hypothetical protein